MDADRFDALTKALIAGVGRRRLVSGLFGGTLASLIAGSETEARAKKAQRKRQERKRDDRERERDRVSDEKKKKKKKKKKKGKKTPPVQQAPDPGPSPGPPPPPVSGVPCPECGECQACDLATGDCGTPCADSCLARDLCHRANGNADFQRLTAHVASAGYAAADVPDAYAVTDAGQALRSVLALRYRHSARSNELVALTYVEEATGEMGASAVVWQDRTISHLLMVENGTVKSVDPSELPSPASAKNAVLASGAEANSSCWWCENGCEMWLGGSWDLTGALVCGALTVTLVGGAVCWGVVLVVVTIASNEACDQICNSSYCCGDACAGQANCCHGRCVDFSSDPMACGDCQTQCADDQTCDEGDCGCGGVSCSGQCCNGVCCEPDEACCPETNTCGPKDDPCGDQECASWCGALCYDWKKCEQCIDGTIVSTCWEGRACCEETGTCGPAESPCCPRDQWCSDLVTTRCCGPGETCVRTEQSGVHKCCPNELATNGHCCDGGWFGVNVCRSETSSRCCAEGYECCGPNPAGLFACCKTNCSICCVGSPGGDATPRCCQPASCGASCSADGYCVGGMSNCQCPS